MTILTTRSKEMDRATKTEMERRLGQAKDLEKHIEDLKGSMQRLKALEGSEYAVDITVSSATAGGGDHGPNAVVITASTSALDCFTPAEVRPILQLMIGMLSQKQSLLNKEYAAL